MSVAYIKDTFVVTSKSDKKKLYFLKKDLKCQCKGFLFRNTCRHQKAVVKYIESGATVDVARVPVNYEYNETMSKLWIYSPERADRYEKAIQNKGQMPTMQRIF